MRMRLASALVLLASAFSQAQVVIDAGIYPDVPSAVDTCPAGHECHVIIPPGEHPLPRPIVLRSGIRLIGSGVQATRLTWAPSRPRSSPGASRAIVARGRAETVGVVAQAISADSDRLRALTSTQLRPGDRLRLGYGDLNSNAEGQLVAVHAVRGGQVALAQSVGNAIAARTPIQRLSLVSDIAIEGLTIAWPRNWAVELVGVENVDIGEVRIEPQEGGAILLGYARSARLHDVSVQRGLYGVRLVASQLVCVEDCRLDNVWGPNFGLVYVNDSRFTRIQIRTTWEQLDHGISGDAFSVSASWRNTFEENRARNVSCYGFWLTFGSGRNQIRHNLIDRSYTAAFHVMDGVANGFWNNRVLNVWGSTAIVVLRSAGTVVAENRVLAYDRGLIALDTEDTAVVGNLGRNLTNGPLAPLERNPGLIDSANDW